MSSPLPGTVRVTGNFIQGSTATGVLEIIVNNDHIHYHRIFGLLVVDELGIYIDDVVSGLAGGLNSVSLFVIDKNEIPINRVATRPKITLVEDGR